MILLLRIILVCLIIYLLIRSFSRYGDGREKEVTESDRLKKNRVPGKKISGSVGDYVDFEELERK